MNTPLKHNNENHDDSVLQAIKDRSESYLSTIYAIHGFIFAVKKYSSMKSDEIFSSIGRRMNYLSKLHKKDICTPDLIIQLGLSEGIVGEAKLLVCKNIDDHWIKYIKQLKKYDSDLIGWWTGNEQISQTSLVWITEITFSAQISDYFQSKIDTEEVQFNRPLAVIEFSKHQRAREYLFLRSKMGTMPDPSMERYFKNGIDIALEPLIVENKEKKFYDARPQDIEYIMEILWQNIFTQYAVCDEGGSAIYDAENKIWRIPINLDNLTSTVQKLYGSVGSQHREVQYPQTSWIRDALDKFVSIKLAEKGDQEKEYVIIFKRFSKPLEKFVSLINKKKKKLQNEEIQLELFSTNKE